MFGKFLRKSKQKSSDDDDKASVLSVSTTNTRRVGTRARHRSDDPKDKENEDFDQPMASGDDDEEGTNVEKDTDDNFKQRSPEPIETDTPTRSSLGKRYRQEHKAEESNGNGSSNSNSDLTSDEDILNLKSILSWKHSENSLLSALSLQIEKERSRQERLKLKNLEKTLDVLNLAISYKVPKDSIPLLFNNSIKLTSEDARKKLASYKEHAPSTSTATTSLALPHSARQHTHAKSHSSSISSSASMPGTNQPSTSVFKVSMPQQVHYQFHHWQGPGQGTITSTSNDDVSNAKRHRKLSDASFSEQPSFSSISGNTTLMSPRESSIKGHISQLPSLSSLNHPIITSSPKSPLRKSIGHRRNLSETAASTSKYQPSYNRQFISSNFNTPPRHTHQQQQPLPVPIRSPRYQQQYPQVLEGSISGNFVFPPGPVQPQPSSRTQTTESSTSSGSHHHHRKSQSKTDVNFMISPPDPSDLKK